MWYNRVMPKGIYQHKALGQKQYPSDLVEQVQHCYLRRGMSMIETASEVGTTVKVLQRLMPRHGIIRRRAIKRNQRGEANANWKGSSASYAAFHRRLDALYGKPQYCQLCCTQDKRRAYDWANLSGRYDDPEDYKRLCRSCHWKLDKKIENITNHAK